MFSSTYMYIVFYSFNLQIHTPVFSFRRFVTAAVPVACFALLFIRLLNGVSVKYNMQKLGRGMAAAAISWLFFYASLSDTTDPYRLLHGENEPTVPRLSVADR